MLLILALFSCEFVFATSMNVPHFPLLVTVSQLHSTTISQNRSIAVSGIVVS